MMRALSALLLFLLPVLPVGAQCWRYVDPRIGSVGVGRTFPGPSMPFGMVKPGPDCGVLPNAGWAPVPEAVSGFSQTHVSGTGGGQKYGNILLQPFSGVQECRSSGVQEFGSSGVQEFGSSGVQEFRSSDDSSGGSSGVQEFGSSGVQEFRSSDDSSGGSLGVQEFGSSGVQEFGSSGVQECRSSDDSSGGSSGVQTIDYSQRRVSEDIALGYYATTFENGIRTEITTSERCAHYRFHYPGQAKSGLLVDASHFLGKDTIPDLRERQQFVGAEVEVVDSHNVRGYSRVRGGWNNGDAYTVYFWLNSDRPFTAHHIADAPQANVPHGNAQSSILNFQSTDTLVNVKVGISYVSEQQARRNIDTHGFDRQLTLLRQAWEQQLQKVSIVGTDREKRMFYTALYHTMLMPVDKTGENPKWGHGMEPRNGSRNGATEWTRNGATEWGYGMEPRNGHGWDTDGSRMYYDDFYAIWDTYRTSSPLLTLLDPQREVDIVNALLNIYVREGYLPDARSGDCNGRTQGGSNADVVIADAFVKGLQGIDYELALQAMLKDGEADPGADHEKHGRGGLSEYLRLGYVPYGIDRAGTRTVEYAFCDYCISVVASGMGRDDLARRYARRSANWRNLWRGDYEYDGMKGYIMPRDAGGRWLDSVVWGRSAVYSPKIRYTPVTKVAPWYIPWWSTFFYEATSQEYSLCVPHDVEGLIEACGGPEAFRRRLDRFFARGYYNVQNEPSFLTPCLYHWIGRPDLSTQRIHQIVGDHYSDSPDGLPGNDDSGAMSSWLAFHMMGLYPNAGHDYYLLSVPLLSEYTLQLPGGKHLHVRRTGKGMAFKRVLLNGRLLDDARLRHQDLLEGGELVFECSKKGRGAIEAIEAIGAIEAIDTIEAIEAIDAHSIAFTLNRQLRTWPLSYRWEGDTLSVVCKHTEYRIARRIVDEGDRFCWHSPQTDGTVYHSADGTFAFISRHALQQLLDTGAFVYDGITWRLKSRTDTEAVVMADIDRTVMRLSLNGTLPYVLEMARNPLGIDWKME